MTKKSLFVTAVLLAAYVLNACGNAPMPSSAAPGAAKVDASIVAYVGAIEGMNGNQWIVGGQTLAVDPAMVRNGPFQVGDVVKVEATVNPDGSLTVSRIEAPSADDLTTLPPAAENANDNSNDANGNANINDDANVNSNDDNDNDANANDDDNDDNGNANSNDDDSDDDDNGNANSNANDSGDKVNGGSHDDGGDDDDGDDESDDD